MDDSSRPVLDTETPVNPYSLLEAVNRSSDSANAAWLIFLGLMAYVTVTVAGVTHKDLLLNSAISLPVLQVQIDLKRFFLFAPILFVLMHVGVIGQLVLLARKALEFASSIRMLESTEERSHPLRLELDNFFFVQSIAGPERSRLVSAFLHGMSWLTLVLLPLALLLYVQLVFLPYHDQAITWVHRAAVLADIALLVFIGVFLWRLETSFFRAFLYSGARHPIGFLATGLLLAAVAFFSVLVVTIPEDADAAESTGPAGPRAVLGVALPPLATGDGLLLGLFPRNLSVADTDLVVDKDVTPGEPSLNLRGRDLRHARLDRSDLHQADLTGADLDGASLVAADLRGAWIGCADLNELMLSDSRRAARCASARGANFSKARLAGANLSGVDLRSARLDDAQLEGAQLAYASAAGASFGGAKLARADLTGATLPGANFLLASLEGADLTGARLPLADLGSANLNGASLAHAGLEGARLREAEMEGTNLQLARLHASDLGGARLQGADLSGAVVWRTVPPLADNANLTDMAQAIMRPPTEEEVSALTALMAGADEPSLRARLVEGMVGLSDAAQNSAWASAPELQAWRALSALPQPEGYKGRLTEQLGKLMCRPRFAGGGVATGVARRAMAPGFKGDMPALYDRLKAPDCPAAGAMSPPMMRALAIAADSARGQ